MSATELLAQVEAATADDQWALIRDAARLLLPEDQSARAKINSLCDAGGHESAALALCERVLPDWRVAKIGEARESDSAGPYVGGWSVRLHCPLKQLRQNLAYGRAGTAALALIAAAFDAILAQASVTGPKGRTGEATPSGKGD